MMFSSIRFGVFLLFVFILYWTIFNKNYKSQNFLLLLASTLFYCIADWKFISIIAFSGIYNFYLAKYIHKNIGKKRKLYFYSGLIFNISLLFYFKYFNFFVESFVSFFDLFSINLNFYSLKILLPLGISYYTFQLIGYLIDVNNNEYEPTNDLLSYFTYLLYFPKILSGPIEKIQRFLPQIQRKREFSSYFACDGIWQILWGLFKKIVIADNCTPIVNDIYLNYSNVNSSTLLLCSILFMISLYADFSGYSDIACGVSKLFGIRIVNNFAFPFFSTNVSQFWKKWHISLTNWMMEYIFTPLSFIFRNYQKIGLSFAIILTFIVVGVWHGANWTFILYGTLHGLYFIPIVLIRGTINKPELIGARPYFSTMTRTIKMIFLFLLVSITCIIIRADSALQAIDFISRIFSSTISTFPKLTGENNTTLFIVIIMILPLILIEWQYHNKENVFAGFESKGPFNKLIVFLFILISIFIFGGSQQAFIYFKY